MVDTWTYGGNAVAPNCGSARATGYGCRSPTAYPRTPRCTGTAYGSATTWTAWHRDQPAIGANGGTFEYDFVAPDSGTYWYHSHSGLQADRGLFGAMIVEDPDDSTGADADAVLVLDDWIDGLGTTPDAVLMALNPAIAGGHAGHGGSASAPTAHSEGEMGVAQQLVAQGHGDSTALGGMTQHIAYPMHLINGRPPNDPAAIEAPVGQRLRMRIINAAAETPYRFAVAGHELTVVAVDGFDVRPAVAATVIVGMAQRIDVLVTVRSGVWPVVAKVEGRDGYASTVLRTPDAVPLSNPDVGGVVPELSGRLVLESELRPVDAARLEDRNRTGTTASNSSRPATATCGAWRAPTRASSS